MKSTLIFSLLILINQTVCAETNFRGELFELSDSYFEGGLKVESVRSRLFEMQKEKSWSENEWSFLLDFEQKLPAGESFTCSQASKTSQDSCLQFQAQPSLQAADKAIEETKNKLKWEEIPSLSDSESRSESQGWWQNNKTWALPALIFVTGAVAFQDWKLVIEKPSSRP